MTSEHMTMSDYQREAGRTASGDMTISGPMGLAGEAGEVVDYLKKVHFHGHKFDQNKLAEELGDALWYVSAVAVAYGLDLGDIAARNIEKLRARYPEGFSHERSRDR